jgi:hypothetical protein
MMWNILSLTLVFFCFLLHIECQPKGSPQKKNKTRPPIAPGSRGRSPEKKTSSSHRIDVVSPPSRSLRGISSTGWKKSRSPSSSPPPHYRSPSSSPPRRSVIYRSLSSSPPHGRSRSSSCSPPPSSKGQMYHSRSSSRSRSPPSLVSRKSNTRSPTPPRSRSRSKRQMYGSLSSSPPRSHSPPSRKKKAHRTRSPPLPPPSRSNPSLYRKRKADHAIPRTRSRSPPDTLKPFKCSRPHCSSSYSSLKQLNDHLSRGHGALQCANCFKMLSRKDSLTRHQGTCRKAPTSTEIGTQKPVIKFNVNTPQRHRYNKNGKHLTVADKRLLKYFARQLKNGVISGTKKKRLSPKTIRGYLSHLRLYMGRLRKLEINKSIKPKPIMKYLTNTETIRKLNTWVLESRYGIKSMSNYSISLRHFLNMILEDGQWSEPLKKLIQVLIIPFLIPV